MDDWMLMDVPPSHAGWFIAAFIRVNSFNFQHSFGMGRFWRQIFGFFLKELCWDVCFQSNSSLFDREMSKIELVIAELVKIER